MAERQLSDRSINFKTRSTSSLCRDPLSCSTDIFCLFQNYLPAAYFVIKKLENARQLYKIMNRRANKRNIMKKPRCRKYSEINTVVAGLSRNPAGENESNRSTRQDVAVALAFRFRFCFHLLGIVCRASFGVQLSWPN